MYAASMRTLSFTANVPQVYTVGLSIVLLGLGRGGYVRWVDFRHNVVDAIVDEHDGCSLCTAAGVPAPAHEERAHEDRAYMTQQRRSGAGSEGVAPNKQREEKSKGNYMCRPWGDCCFCMSRKQAQPQSIGPCSLEKTYVEGEADGVIEALLYGNRNFGQRISGSLRMA